MYIHTYKLGLKGFFFNKTCLFLFLKSQESNHIIYLITKENMGVLCMYKDNDALLTNLDLGILIFHVTETPAKLSVCPKK